MKEDLFDGPAKWERKWVHFFRMPEFVHDNAWHFGIAEILLKCQKKKMANDLPKKKCITNQNNKVEVSGNLKNVKSKPFHQ